MPKRAANSGSFKKGNTYTRKDVPNKYSATMRDMVLQAFMDMGGVKEFVKWGKGKKNRAVFYNIAAKLIPMDVTSGGKELKAPIVGLQVSEKPNE